MKFPKYLVVLTTVGTGVGLFVLFKDRMGGAKFVGKERIAGRTVIITGANAGIGKETALELSKRGGRIIMACRDMTKCERVRQEIVTETFNENVHCRKLDLASVASIKAFAKAVNESEKRIDILINNAGVMYENRALTEDGFEIHLGVNYLGHFLLTNLLLDKMIASAPSRIINVACVGYNNTNIHFRDLNSAKSYDAKDAYKHSKLALTLFTTELAKRLQGTKVTVNIVQPGLALTGIRDNFGMNKSVLSGTILKPFWLLIFKTPVYGAQCSIYAALESSIADKTGRMFCENTEVTIDKIAFDEATSKRLWAISEHWTRLKE